MAACPVCGAYCGSPHDFAAHYRLCWRNNGHLKSVKSFARKRGLFWICRLCGTNFFSVSDFERHFSAWHDPNGPHFAEWVRMLYSPSGLEGANPDKGMRRGRFTAPL